MTFKLQRPLLIGGLGLTVGGWLLESIHPSTLHLGGTVVWGAIALGSGVWWLRQQFPQDSIPEMLKNADRATVEAEFAAVEQAIQHLYDEIQLAPRVENAPRLEGHRDRLLALRSELERRHVRLSVMGGKAVGKTTLAQRLLSHLSGQSPTASSIPTNTPTRNLETSDAEAHRSDLVLFVTAGDLTDTEYQRLQTLLQRQQRVLLIFNKQDQYLPTDRAVVLQQLRDRLRDHLSSDDVVAIATQPSPILVRQHQPDGSLKERLDQPEPELDGLLERVQAILSQEGTQLILNTAYRQAVALKQEVLADLNGLRRDRALPVIEQAQWIAGAAAFANPVASLDLLATAAINTQLIMDLAKLYQQPLTLDQARVIATTLASQMVKLGLVELTSQAVSSLLKSHALTYVAGGLIQGVSAAYLTRLAGLTLVTYFEDQSQILVNGSESTFSVERLVSKLKQVFQDNQRTAFIQTLVSQGIQKLVPAGTPILASAADA